MILGPNDIPSTGGLITPKVWVQFRILTMRWNPLLPTIDIPNPSPKEGLRQIVEIPGPRIEEVELADFINAHRNDRAPSPSDKELSPAAIGKTPWDIDVEHHLDEENKNRQRILIIHLDSAFEWEFTKGTRGVTSKDEVRDEDGGLHYLDPITKVGRPMPDTGLPIGCSMIYWSLLKRSPLPTGGGAKARRFNFHIDLINPDTRRHMPTVFDPNIPDNGGSTIP